VEAESSATEPVCCGLALTTSGVLPLAALLGSLRSACFGDLHRGGDLIGVFLVDGVGGVGVEFGEAVEVNRPGESGDFLV